MTAHPVVPSSNNSRAVHYGCPVKSSNHTYSGPLSSIVHEVTVIRSKTYNWDQKTQGLLLGSFFWSYFLFMVPSGILAEKFGARWIISANMAGAAIISSLFPLIADYHYSFTAFSRFMLGALQSGFYPAAFGMFTKWFPLKERSFAFALIDIGAVLGSCLTYLGGGTMIENWGWPSLFYVPAAAAMVMSVIFLTGVRSQPDDHPLVTEQELKKIRSMQTTGEGKKVTAPSPAWFKIMTCPSVLATASFKFGSYLCATVIYLELPKYLSEVIHENITDNGSINAALNIIMMISLTVNGLLSEHMIQKGWMSRTTTRKVFSVFNGTLAPICLALIPVVGCNTTLLRILICLNAFLFGFTTGADGPIASEMTQNFPSILYALFNMVAMSTGFILPYFVGIILDSYEDPTSGWPLVFYIPAAICITSNIGYIMFAQAKRQNFDMIMSEEEERSLAEGFSYGPRRSISPMT